LRVDEQWNGRRLDLTTDCLHLAIAVTCSRDRSQLLRRITSIFALVFFLLGGGLGAGARLNLCVESDGTVKIESSFNRCCDRTEKHSHPVEECDHECDHAPPALERIATANSLDNCECCIDLPLTLDADHQSVARAKPVVKQLSLHDDLTPPSSSVALLVQPISLNPPRGCDSPPSPALTHLSTVVLRC
jgi:hypothetical protein